MGLPLSKSVVAQAALILTILLFLTRHVLRQLAIRRFMARTGSKLPRTIRGSGFLGLRMARESDKALQRGDYLALLRSRFAANGHTYQGSILGIPFTATIEPENLRAVFTHIDDFTKSGRMTDWWPMLQGGVLVADGSDWKMSRAKQNLLKPAFAHQKRASHKSLAALEDHIATRVLSRIPQDGATVDLQALFLDYTFHAGLSILINQDSSSSTAAHEQSQQRDMLENMQLALFEAGRRAKIGTLRLLDPVVRPRKYWRYLKACWGIHAYFDHVIDLRLAELDSRMARDKVLGKSEEDGGFFDGLADATRDRVQLRWELSTAVAGSKDTMAGLLAHIFWELARRPEVWSRLQAEVDGLGGRMPDDEDLRGGLTYLKAVINEALRMYPTIGITFRWAARDLTLPVGGGPDGKSPCFVPRGRRVITSFNALHRRPDLWGADTDEFKPERFLETIKIIPKWNYLPFGAGQRICPGQHFAMIATHYSVVRMMQTFRRIEARDPRPYAEEAGIPITIKHGALIGLYTS
ncbi:cytochrome P450 [Podospora appendiculata]|uniref:Cytochrome P450 n=1 Tax=Podospora appendiculata TaxID=314037 RepID=A0AAE0XBU5_9PEZI|nr:cytochrome P450 [Podospora appendiculata]